MSYFGPMQTNQNFVSFWTLCEFFSDHEIEFRGLSLGEDAKGSFAQFNLGC